jgi:hypothetical protein
VEPRKRKLDIGLPAQKRPTLLYTRQPGPAGEAPDDSRKIAVGKSEIAENKQKNEHDPGLQSNMPLGPEPACLDGKP